ncbi:MAG: hypothetical protein KC543_03435 [Myxococcales bacterium]|nr:hypothetical protein [Myxococcales bacterium]
MKRRKSPRPEAASTGRRAPSASGPRDLRPPSIPASPAQQRALVDDALRLRDEQLDARVVYVEPDSETNAELDVITATVVRDVRRMQREGRAARRGSDESSDAIEAQTLSPAEREARTEAALTKNLAELLDKMVSEDRERLLRHQIERIQRRILQRFFNDEIFTDPRRSVRVDARVFGPDEAVYIAMRRHNDAMLATIDGFTYSDGTTRREAVERLRAIQQDLLKGVLGGRSAELERLLSIFADVLLVFLRRDLRSELSDVASRVIRESGVARTSAATYKIDALSFRPFRRVFERLFLERLLAGLSGSLERRLADPETGLRAETIRFAGDPGVYAEVCAVLCNGTYEYLHGEGFLDLPSSWKRHLLTDRA